MSLVLIAGGLISPTLASGQCAPIRYTEYEDSNFGGHAISDCTSVPDLRIYNWGPFPWQDMNDAISSVKTYSQWVQYYDGLNYTTPIAYYIANSNVSWVGANYNDRFSSVWNGF